MRAGHIVTSSGGYIIFYEDIKNNNKGEKKQKNNCLPRPARFRCFYDLKRMFPGLLCTLNPRRNLAIPHFPGAKSIYKAVGYIDIDRVHVYFMPGRAQPRTANKQTIYCLRLFFFFFLPPYPPQMDF